MFPNFSLRSWEDSSLQYLYGCISFQSSKYFIYFVFSNIVQCTRTTTTYCISYTNMNINYCFSYFTWGHATWAKQGVKGDRPLPLFGTFLSTARAGVSFTRSG